MSKITSNAFKLRAGNSFEFAFFPYRHKLIVEIDPLRRAGESFVIVRNIADNELAFMTSSAQAHWQETLKTACEIATAAQCG